MNIGIVLPEPGYLEAVARPVHQARRRAHLRRGEVGRDGRGGRAPSSASACSPTSPASPRRSPAACPCGAFGGQRRHHGRDRRGRRPAGHVQRQPARVAAGVGDAHRGAHPRRVRAPRGARAPGWPTGAGKAIADHGLPAPRRRPRVPRAACPTDPSRCTTTATSSRRRTDLFDASWPVARQPRRVHDPRRRGAVDDLGAAHRRRHRPLRRRLRRVLRRRQRLIVSA